MIKQNVQQAAQAMQILNRITFPLFSLLVLFLPVSSASFAIESDTSRQPNIVLIMADDVGWEAFGCYGGQDYKTPNIDKLASQGIRFNHCHSTPICTTSRVKIMTGKYNFRNYTHFGYLDPEQRTFGNMLQDAGYKTAIAGKWQLNGLANKLPRYDDAKRPHDAGFDEYLLWQCTKAKAVGERFWHPVLEHNGKLLDKNTNRNRYGPDMLCDFVCDFMQRHKDEPFFVYYPMVLVHDPFVPTPDTIGNNAKSNRQPKDKGEKKKNFVAMVQYMDRIVGRIARQVEEIGQAENTIIMFTADNGTNRAITSRWNGRQIRGGKAGMKDMGTHVPFVARWTDHTPVGTVSNDLIDFVDFYPTLADAAGVFLSASEAIDGRSFYKQLVGEKGNPRDWLLCHYQPYWNKLPGQFVRNAEFKLYRDGRMYNVPMDLDETNDLSKAADPKTDMARRQLQQVLKECPPAPTQRLGKDAKERPVYPGWKSLHEK